MPTLDFGQPERGIIQMAYVVPDIRAAMAQWTLDLHVGPWFLLDHFTGDDPSAIAELTYEDLAAQSPDTDGDGVRNLDDNCMRDANPGQEDADDDHGHKNPGHHRWPGARAQR